MFYMVGESKVACPRCGMDMLVNALQAFWRNGGNVCARKQS